MMLGMGLDTFGHYGDFEFARERHDGFDDGEALRIIANALDEASVDLQLVPGEGSQIGQGRIARAEIIERD